MLTKIKAINNKKPLVLVILGPTSSGKTALATRLAAKYQGEIISADSRQIYRGLDVGTGKDLFEYQQGACKIPYHLIDIVSPRTPFSLAKYQKLAFKTIVDVLKRKKLPIIVGGAGLYLQAVIDNYQLNTVKPSAVKRRILENLNLAELWDRLQKIKANFANQLNNSDRHNRRRLIRYLEIAESELSGVLDGQEINSILDSQEINSQPVSSYNFLILGLDWPTDILRTRINQRLRTRLEKEDLIGEVKRLHQAGITWKRLISFGLEYKFISYYLLNKLDYQEMFEQLVNANYRLAKRQKTWFRRWQKQGRQIFWIKNKTEAEKIIKRALKTFK